jgi:putative transposase
MVVCAPQPPEDGRCSHRSIGGHMVARGHPDGSRPPAQRLEIEARLTPFRAPRANAVAERVVRTLRHECLDHVLVRNERHLECVLREDVAYDNRDRPHRSLGLVPPLPGAPLLRVANGPPGRIVARPVLGGRHHVYQRAA